jgi:6-phosphofructokinase 1
MKAFLCYSSPDKEFVLQVAKYLRTSGLRVFYFEDPAMNRGDFVRVLNSELAAADVFIAFVGSKWTEWQEKELNAATKRETQPETHAVFLPQSARVRQILLSGHPLVTFSLVLEVQDTHEKDAIGSAHSILRKLNVPIVTPDDLPLDPHLFSYEKDIIDFFRNEGADQQDRLAKLQDGCPASWPRVARWEEMLASFRDKRADLDRWRRTPYASRLYDVGEFRQPANNVVAAALTTYHKPKNGCPPSASDCLVEQELLFPEAGPRKDLHFPPLHDTNTLNVAILVSGGIAPGINAVIDGIVQRHWLYARRHNQCPGLTIYGLQNGFHAFEAFPNSYIKLAPDHDERLGDRSLVTSDHANEGGSVLGTSRVDELIDLNTRMERLEIIVDTLRRNQIDILYVIGGDGSMKAAHAIWSVARNTPERPLSVVAVPKTMDNDILWVWQAFGFLSAVEKAREVIEHLHTEVKSNPRLCILQLFGSDSGFVVSHSVLASATGHCDVALIPEVPFSMTKLARVLKEKMCRRMQRILYGLVVMAETAIPTDATDYAAPLGKNPKVDVGLTRSEQDEILNFDQLRKKDKRIQGQTSDVLRTAGLKIVSRGLPKLLSRSQLDQDIGFEPEWGKMRVFTNEPRHLLRAISPSCSDIIFGQRLGILAVDNAMAGYTDFMISQWLTEYVLVPLKLVVLGRKRIPRKGIFWKSVLAKTGQPEKLE